MKFKNKLDMFAFWAVCGLGATAMICQLALLVGVVVTVALNLK